MNPKETKNNQIDSNPIDETSWFHVGIGMICLIIFIIILFYYCLVGNQSNFKFDAEKMGQLGDYIGGLLNPVLAFSSFMALLYTIQLQRDELKQNKKTQEEQINFIIKQQFESTFFALLKEITTMVKDVESSFIDYNKNYQSLYARDETIPTNLIFIEILLEYISYTDYRVTMKNQNESIENINIKMKKVQEAINSRILRFQEFSLLIYQTLDFIDKSSIKDKNEYSNFLKACIPYRLLQLIAINTHRPDSDLFKSYKKLLENLKFLEYMPFDINGKLNLKGNPLLFYLKDIYAESAFGDSEYIKQLNQSLKT